MALIKCPECGKEISSNATACPNCGNPVPKRMCDVCIERSSSLLGGGLSCYVYIDGNMIGELKRGGTLNLSLPVGIHVVSTESNARNWGYSASGSSAKSGQQFTITDNTRSVSIYIAQKGNWAGGAGSCIVESVRCY